MNILLIGSGGREHALAWKLSASPLVETLYCAPGNAGIANVAECVALDVGEHAAVVAFCREHRIDFVIIGPEAPLVAGLADDLAAAGIKHFGPSKAAAQLEGSKGFTKDLCAEFNIPTAAYGRFKDSASAKSYLARQTLPIVVKADGLAAGKGVVIADTRAEAEAAIDACFAGAFGAAGAEVVIEEFLVGEEASFFALCDGTHALALATAQDHKRVGDGDTGPNTGGMGAYSPAPVMTPEMVERTMREIIAPTVAGMQKRGTPFRGVLFAGLMITADGPKLIEYNARFGDPETQVLMMRLKSDLLAALLATADGVLDTFDVRWRDEVALTVVMAAKGYPGVPLKGTEIRGLDEAAKVEGVEVFHAGTRLLMPSASQASLGGPREPSLRGGAESSEPSLRGGAESSKPSSRGGAESSKPSSRGGARIVADGGRVLNVTAIGRTVAEAQARAYAAIAKIDWPGGFCRTDIGWRAIERERTLG